MAAHEQSVLPLLMLSGSMEHIRTSVLRPAETRLAYLARFGSKDLQILVSRTGMMSQTYARARSNACQPVTQPVEERRPEDAQEHNLSPSLPQKDLQGSIGWENSEKVTIYLLQPS